MVTKLCQGLRLIGGANIQVVNMFFQTEWVAFTHTKKYAIHEQAKPSIF